MALENLEDFINESPLVFKDNLFIAPAVTPIDSPFGEPTTSVQAHYTDPETGLFSVVFVGDDHPAISIRNTFVNLLNGIPVEETPVHAAIRRRYFCN